MACGNYGAPVSAVIPCYRNARTIRRAVSSIEAQTMPVHECILVNDGADEETAGAIALLQNDYQKNWLRLVTLPHNSGAGSARNAGWDTASGRYVAFLDADDAWHPRKIEIQFKEMENHPEIALSGHAYRVETSEPDWSGYKLPGESTIVTPRRILLSNQFITSSAMVRSEMSVRFAEGQRHMEDFRLWSTIALQGNRIIKLMAELGCIYKPIYGASGLSADMLKMEIGELRSYLALARIHPTVLSSLPFLIPYSLAKFLWRLVRKWSSSASRSRQLSQSSP